MHNNFDAVRLLLALIVVCAHLCDLTGIPNIQAFRTFFDAEFAVKGFFTISGYLVMGSYLNSKSFKEYAEKRVRRIYPAYAATIFLCLIMGLVVTTYAVSDFILSSQTVRYLFANLVFLNFLQPTLPGVFDGNPSQAINGALWTIKIEVLLYCYIPFIWFSFRTLSKTLATILFYVASLLGIYLLTPMVTSPWKVQFAFQLFSYFTLGAFFATEPRVSRFLPLLLLSSGAIYLLNDPIPRLWIEPLFFGSLVVVAATRLPLTLPAGKYGDLSYGVYLLHFPVIQLMVYFQAYQNNPWPWCLITIVLVAALAWISWHLIEKPMLKRSSHYIQAEK